MLGQRILALVIPKWVTKPTVGEPWFRDAVETKNRLRSIRRGIGKHLDATASYDNRLKDQLLDEDRMAHMRWFQNASDNRKRLRHMRLLQKPSPESACATDNCLSGDLLDDAHTLHTHEMNQLAVEYWTESAGEAAQHPADLTANSAEMAGTGTFMRKAAHEKAAQRYAEHLRQDCDRSCGPLMSAWLIAEGGSTEARLKLAKDLSCPVAVLEKLIKDSDRHVAWAANKSMRILLEGDEGIASGRVGDWHDEPFESCDQLRHDKAV